MRSIDDIESRWSQLFNTSIGVDLRQAIRDDSTFDPCEEGLRSVCWRAFLLNGPLSKGSWSKKLTESRSAYASLRDHFLKYIDHPNDLHSSADPLADDDNSPWATLRQDESSREEIFQDVTRCMQDNYFFREPGTQRKLLDILFIYSKLNPDTGYRQGMHELLAPIVWVIHQDAVEANHVPDDVKAKEGIDFMLEVLDHKYIEHDAFNLFCAVMQTAKSFYEMGDNRDSSAIIAQSERIHKELLAAVDPDLSYHLQVIGILPQIYSIRWIRLLFGREFEFKQVLKMWDLLFAENISLEVVDMTCVVMLLAVRWQLIDADYTSAITLLTRFSLPSSVGGPRSLVKDASYLNKHRNPEAGAAMIERLSGTRPKVVSWGEDHSMATHPNQARPVKKVWSQHASPSRSPARFSTPQKQIEGLFQEVSGTLQRRAEGWNVQGVSKALRGAVGEVRRNVNNLQASHSRQSSTDIHAATASDDQAAANAMRSMQKRITILETRNKALAKMLESALDSLRTCKMGKEVDIANNEDDFNMSLAKIQFVSVYLTDSEIPIPMEEKATAEAESHESTMETKVLEVPAEPEQIQPKKEPSPKPQPEAKEIRMVKKEIVQDRPMTPDEIIGVVPRTVIKKSRHERKKAEESLTTDEPSDTIKPHSRPSLADSSFSFMLGENRKRSSFVSSVSALPEQSRSKERRDSESKNRPKNLGNENKKKDKKEPSERKSADGDDPGFTLSSIRGGR